MCLSGLYFSCLPLSIGSASSIIGRLSISTLTQGRNYSLHGLLLLTKEKKCALLQVLRALFHYAPYLPSQRQAPTLRIPRYRSPDSLPQVEDLEAEAPA